MPEPDRHRSNNPFWWILAALPLASWVAISAYASRFDGWGGWAAAPLFLIPIALGVVGALSGMLRIVSFPSGSAGRRVAWAQTLLASPPVLWFLWRLLTAG
jgi:hypothetical protein